MARAVGDANEGAMRPLVPASCDVLPRGNGNGTRAAIRSRGGDTPSTGNRHTARQDAIAAKEQLLEEKRREASRLKKNQKEMIKAAKAEAEKAFLARMQSIRQKDAASKQQRRTAATERIAKIRDKIENQSRQLKSKMEEKNELENITKIEQSRKRRESIDYKQAAWSRERKQKADKREGLRKEALQAMQSNDLFREAKAEVRRTNQTADKFERTWRTRQGMLGRRVEENSLLRREKPADQGALEAQGAEQIKLRGQTSALWRNTKTNMKSDLSHAKRGQDSLVLAVTSARKDNPKLQTPDVKEMKKALRRQSADKRRLSGARERILHGRQKQALTKGLRTAASDTREVCPGRECESLAESRRTRCMESSALDGRVGRYRRQMDKEERAIQILQREDAMAHKHELEGMERADREFRRAEVIRARRERLESAKKFREEEEREQRIQNLDDHSQETEHKPGVSMASTGPGAAAADIRGVPWDARDTMQQEAGLSVAA